jgi:hypothetical protein
MSPLITALVAQLRQRIKTVCWPKLGAVHFTAIHCGVYVMDYGSRYNAFVQFLPDGVHCNTNASRTPGRIYSYAEYDHNIVAEWVRDQIEAQT